MIFYGVGIAVLLAGWLFPVFQKTAERVNRAGMIAGVTGCVFVFIAGILGVSGNPGHEIYLVFWRLPAGQALFSLKPLSSFFLLLISLVSGLASVYAPGYLRHYGEIPGRLKQHWFLFNALVVSMMCVVTAENAVFFMISWELMSLSSYFLVEFSNERPETRRAGWIYLVFTHVGAAFLLVMFSLLARESGSFDFEAFRSHASHIAPDLSAVLFVCALIGFGMKAGFFPAHVWLPEAHPAAPSHVSAIMSGVMIKTAIYGILLVLSFMGEIRPWEGWLILILGVVSGLAGIVMAISRQNMKGMLAYSSVENIGIIGMALGIGILGEACGNTTLMFLGFAGALLHVLNHSLFKSLLFLGAGSLQTSAETLDLNRMGGLLKRLPRTGATMVLGAVAISGLPPLGGFASEFLIYSSAVGVSFPTQFATAAFSILVIAGLSLIGALAVYAFAKLVGIALLGEPRSREAEHAHEVSPSMYWPMVALGLLCVAVGLFPGAALGGMENVLADLQIYSLDASISAIRTTLSSIQIIAFALLALVGILYFVRKRALAGKEVSVRETWGCGYDRPDSRMQYTASSFAEPILSFTRPLTKTTAPNPVDRGFFPAEEEFRTETSDPVMRRIVSGYRRLQDMFARVTVIQHGNIHLYVLYIVAALFAALVWSLGL